MVKRSCFFELVTIILVTICVMGVSMISAQAEVKEDAVIQLQKRSLHTSFS